MTMRFTFETVVRKYETGEDGKQQMVETWQTDDTATTSSKAVMAGLLRAKAQELEGDSASRGY